METVKNNFECLIPVNMWEHIFTWFFCLPPYILVDGLSNGQLLTIYQATSLTACSPVQDFYLNLKYQTCTSCLTSFLLVDNGQLLTGCDLTACSPSQNLYLNLFQ